MQHIHAELYHNATALRGINGPTDVQQMPDAQRQLAIRSIHVARKCLDITLTSPAYREGMKYGNVPQITHLLLQKFDFTLFSRALHSRYCNVLCVAVTPAHEIVP
jgi:hypothetical protein